MKQILTGQIITRRMGEKDGRTLFMVVGLLAVPKGEEWLDDHQYTVCGDNRRLRIDHTAPIDRRKDGSWGMTADAMLKAPWWRI